MITLVFTISSVSIDLEKLRWIITLIIFEFSSKMKNKVWKRIII